jgi:DNA-binding CsgD family transcriptional regulator
LIKEFRESGGRRRVHLWSSGDSVVLTAREYEVLGHLKRGEHTSEVARLLGISEVTVRRHVSSIEHKLGVADRSGALNRLRKPD